MKNRPTSNDDVIDSRDVEEAITELESELEAEKEAERVPDEDSTLELAALLALREQAQGYVPDWQYGAMLIRDDYFETYARDLAEDIGAIKDDTSWPYTCIDWEQAASELQQDYTSVAFDDVRYWVR